MKRGPLRSLLTGVFFAGFTLGAFADVKENPYQVIIERNPFGLKPIPPPPAPVVDTNPPPVEIEVKLTGISNLTGSPKAFIELIETKTKKTERPPPMIVGDKQGDLEILSIDPESYTVRIRKGGAETTLDFDKNGYKAGTALAGGTPVAQIPGIPPVPGFPQNISGMPNVPNPNSSVVVGAANVGTPSPNFAGNTAVPSRPVRMDTVVAGGGGQGIAPPPPKQLSIDEARQIIEMRRQEMERQRPGSSIILPPSGLNPSQPDAQQAPVPNVPAPVPFRRF